MTVTAIDYNTARVSEHVALRTLGWWPFAADPCTTAGVVEIAAWQAAQGLVSDGKLGPGSWARLRSIYRPTWKPVARGLAEILARFGDPRAAGVTRALWAEQHLVIITVCGHKLRVHREIAAELTELLTVAIYLSGYDPESIQIFNVRHKRGGDPRPGGPSWSTHSWAIALDFDPARNPWGNRPDSPIVTHPLFAAVFRVACWSLGCDWKTPDTMHAQCCTGY
jgi:hypothetical protein